MLPDRLTDRIGTAQASRVPQELGGVVHSDTDGNPASMLMPNAHCPAPPECLDAHVRSMTAGVGS